MKEWRPHWVSVKKRHKSVFRIEQAKQRALGNAPFKHVTAHKDIEQNWTREDEVALRELINAWERATGLEGLNKAIDNHAFSGGTHTDVLSRTPRPQYDFAEQCARADLREIYAAHGMRLPD